MPTWYGTYTRTKMKAMLEAAFAFIASVGGYLPKDNAVYQVYHDINR